MKQFDKLTFIAGFQYKAGTIQPWNVAVTNEPLALHKKKGNCLGALKLEVTLVFGESLLIGGFGVSEHGHQVMTSAFS